MCVHPQLRAAGSASATGSVDGHPDVTLVERAADAPREVTNFGGVWHSDQSFRAEPAAGFTLQVVELPPHGGDTLFANLYLAYETLSAGMRAMLDPLIAVHSFAAGSDPDRGYHDPSATPRSVAALPDVEHPLVRAHPETNRKLLYVSGSWIARFKGMTPQESRRARFPARPCSTTGVHLSLPLDAGCAGAARQPLYATLRDQRLRRLPPRDAPRNVRRRTPDGSTVIP